MEVKRTKWFTSMRAHWKDSVLLLTFLVLAFFLYMLPTNFDDRLDRNAVHCKGKIVEVDNAQVMTDSLVKHGNQKVTVRLLTGPFKNERKTANNALLGQLERDKLFRKGDIVFVVMSINGKGEIVYINPQNHYRLGWELFLFLVFAFFLLLFGGWTGCKALLSFVVTALAIWKILVPCLLEGWPPIPLTFVLVSLLCATIIFLVSGVNRKGVVAFLGAITGLGISCLMAQYFTPRLDISGATLPFASALLNAGYGHLNFGAIFISAVFLAAAGAVMDVAVDVAASMQEVVTATPSISHKALLRSGFTVGRAVVGTMTTTLLFAYSGGYITLLMAFMAQGVPVSILFNNNFVAPEILRTLTGSFGLVAVAPITALIGTAFYKHSPSKAESTD
jgi:uncharacterized membrane protein